MENITYKVATIEDIPMICHFRKTQLIQNGAVFKESIDDELTNFFEENFNNNTIYQIFAYQDNQAIATGAVLFYSYPPSHVNRSGKIAYISNMFTFPEHRKQGIATHILHLLEEEARNRGITSAKLAASPSGKPLYEANGYTPDHLANLTKKL